MLVVSQFVAMYMYVWFCYYNNIYIYMYTHVSKDRLCHHQCTGTCTYVNVYVQHLCCSRVHMCLIAPNLMFLETCMAPLYLYAEVAGPLSHVPPVM